MRLLNLLNLRLTCLHLCLILGLYCLPVCFLAAFALTC